MNKRIKSFLNLEVYELGDSMLCVYMVRSILKICKMLGLKPCPAMASTAVYVWQVSSYPCGEIMILRLFSP